MQPSIFFANLLFIIFLPFLSFGVTLSKTNTLTSDQIKEADRFVVSNGYGYLASTTNDVGGTYNYLAVMDLSTMTIVHKLEDPKFAETPAIAVSGDYVYVVSSFQKTLSIVDATTKNSISIVGHINNDNFAGAHSIAVLGDYAYVSREDSSTHVVTVVSIATKTDPAIETTITLDSASRPTTLAAVSGELFVGSSMNKLSIYDISDPTDPKIVTSLQGPSGCSYKPSGGLLVSGADLYMSVNNHNLAVVDDSGSHTSCLKNDELQEVRLGHVQDDYLYVIAADSGGVNYRLQAIDKTDTSSLTITDFQVSIGTEIPLVIQGDGDKIYILKQGNTVEEISIAQTTEAETTEAETTTVEPSSTEAAAQEGDTDVQGNMTWWLLIIITTLFMCVCCPCGAYINMKYIRPWSAARLERKKEAMKMRKYTLESGAGNFVSEPSSDGFE